MKHLINLRILVLAAIVVIIVATALWIKGASGEDSWICVDGQWIRHGNPSAPMPVTPCTQATIPSSKTAGTASRISAATKSFVADDFSFSYPDWVPLETAKILEPDRTKVAVSQEGCALVVTVRTLPAGTNFQSSMEELLSEQISQSNVRILQKNITPTSSHVEGQFPVENRTVHSDQYGYVTSKRQFYSIVFAAAKEKFAASCEPAIGPTVRSVQVQ